MNISVGRNEGTISITGYEIAMSSERVLKCSEMKTK